MEVYKRQCEQSLNHLSLWDDSNELSTIILIWTGMMTSIRPRLHKLPKIPLSGYYTFSLLLPVLTLHANLLSFGTVKTRIVSAAPVQSRHAWSKQSFNRPFAAHHWIILKPCAISERGIVPSVSRMYRSDLVEKRERDPLRHQFGTLRY